MVKKSMTKEYACHVYRLFAEPRWVHKTV